MAAKSSPCQYELKKSNYCVDIHFLKTPSRSYSSDFELRFIDKKTKKVVMPKDDLKSYLWMKMKSGKEHGSAPFKIEKLKDKYVVTNVWLVMLGDWQLHVQLVKENKVVDKLMTTICVARGGKTCKT